MRLPILIRATAIACRAARPATVTWVLVGCAALWPVLAIARVPPGQTSVWDGVYTDKQADRGRSQYQDNCSRCHGEDMAGKGDAPGLAGDQFMFSWGEKTLADLYSRIQTSMPTTAPGSLSVQAYVDIVAYLLQANKFRAGDEELPGDPARLQSLNIARSAPAAKR